jgi:hypothetical protein
MADYIRSTITITPELKAQMDAVEEAVNWSEVARHAFEAKLAEIAAKKEIKSMDDVITRLRASKRRAESEQYEKGETVGREWAEEYAEADELIHLERWYGQLGRDADAVFGEPDNNGPAASALVAWGACPENDESWPAAQDFWEQALGDDTSAADDPQFVRGFVEGALGLWNRVKHKL